MQQLSARRRASRQDGNATRLHILEVAGRLFADKGYADTTSKAICEQAGINIAAVNYHFGSRDGLYQALLHEAHRRFMDMDFLTHLVQSTQSPEMQLKQLINTFMQGRLQEDNWPVRLWAKEMTNPTPFAAQAFHDYVQPKFSIISGIVSKITGIPVGDPALTCCILHVLAPCLMPLIISHQVVTPLTQLLQYPAQKLVDHATTFALGGLAAVRRNVDHAPD